MDIRAWLVLGIAFGLLTLGACGDTDSEPKFAATVSPTATARPAESVTPTAAATPAVRGTGVAIVDQLSAAIAAKDASKLASSLHFWPRACTEPQGIGALPCPAGAAVGTMVMVIGVGQSEGSWLKSDDPGIAVATQNFVARAGKLYAVLTASTFPNEPDIPGRYQVIFEPGMTLSIDDQGVTYLSFVSGPGGAAGLVASGRFGSNPVYLLRP